MSNPSKKKAFVAAAGRRPQAEINVTPLVDVVLVLLIIFMTVTPLSEKDIEVQVPESTSDSTEPDPSQISVDVLSSGGLTINAQRTAWEEYVPKLRTLLTGHPSRAVFFSIGDDAKYSLAMRALDGAKTAGADVLGVSTDAPVGHR